MGIKQFKPRTPGTRFRMDHTFDEITKDTPEKSLLEPQLVWHSLQPLGSPP